MGENITPKRDVGFENKTPDLARDIFQKRERERERERAAIVSAFALLVSIVHNSKGH